MNISVCFNCGQFKDGPLGMCPYCGKTPQGGDIFVSKGLTDQYCDTDFLIGLSNEIKKRNASKQGFKSAEQIFKELIAINGNTNISQPYLNVAQYAEGAPEIKRYFFSSYVFIMTTSAIIAAKCKNPDMASLLATCHQNMFECLPGAESLIKFGDYIITDGEKLRFVEHFRDKLALDLNNLEECKLPFTALLRSAFLVRTLILGDDVQQVCSESPTGEMDLEKLFSKLAMTFQGFVTQNTMGSLYRERDFNPYQDTFQIMTLQQCLSEYYGAISEVFKNQ